MSPKIGFVLLTHANPAQIERLIARLNLMFGQPPIVCHHDFSQCDLDTRRLAGNVGFVRPHLETAWGGFAPIEGTVRALQQLYERQDSPDWFVYLSGADYPIKPAGTIVADLEHGGYDAHIHFERIRPGHYERDWQRICYERYFVRQFRVPLLNRQLCLKNPMLTQLFSPFSAGFECYAGSQWFAANRHAAQAIVDSHGSDRRLAPHLRSRLHSDEAYFQCILANAPTLRLNNFGYRYIDWPARGPHPKVLTVKDLPAMEASTCHFARKFEPAIDSAVLDELDQLTAP